LYRDILMLNGWKKHQGFGLRKEWISLYLHNPDNWEENNNLGVRQVESLKSWIKTCELDRESQNILFRLFLEKGTEDLLCWEILWVNVVFNFPTALWFIKNIGYGEWDIKEILTRMHKNLSHLSLRTVQDAVYELIGMFERTPIGKDLGQGEVHKEKNRRYIIRNGLLYPNYKSVIYSFIKLFEREKEDRLCLSDDLVWPWEIFLCEKSFITKSVILYGNQFFDIDDSYIYKKYPEEVDLGVALL